MGFKALQNLEKGRVLGVLILELAFRIISLYSCFSFLPFQDQERRTPLHAAAYVGDVPILQLLLMSGESGELGGAAPREGRSLFRSED